ncbi:hypothetical protein D3C86_1675930 [compost metagenome]
MALGFTGLAMAILGLGASTSFGNGGSSTGAGGCGGVTTLGGGGGAGSGIGAISTIIAAGGNSSTCGTDHFSATMMATAWTPSTIARLPL